MSITQNPGCPDVLPLTRVEHERFKATLLAARLGVLLGSTQRQAVRDILRAAGNRTAKPEQCVVAFKSLLNEAANEIGIPLGRDRSSLLERFVSTFIEEMYRMDDERDGAEGSDNADGRAMNARASLPATIPAESRELPGAHP
jgi:hypothetical protein